MKSACAICSRDQRRNNFRRQNNT